MKPLIRALALASSLTPAWPVAAAAGTAVDYSAASSWLCRPGRDDVCSRPLTSTVVSPMDGALTRKTYAPDPSAPIDCFYVYPTVSQEPGANADMTEGPEEDRVAASQFARFSAARRTYAPLYRQTTVAAMDGRAKGADPEQAYGDVLAAWRHYLAHDNHGRGVVLIGHSQGAFLLGRLLAREIDSKPAQRLLVSAILAGGNVQTAAGRDVGGSFQHIPLCRAADQTGCVITYLAADPPGPQAPFGGAARPGWSAACVDAGALTGEAALDAELPTTGRVRTMLGTPLVENPGLISAACASADGHEFLAVSIKPDGVGAAALNRALGDLDSRAPGWGLHAIDVNLALGDLVRIVERQGKAWAAGRR
jgi:hypothetical protein